MPTFPAGKSGSTPRHSRFAIGIFFVLLVFALAAGNAVYRRLVENEERHATETLHHIADIEGAAVSAWVLERLADASVFSSGRFLGETMHTWLGRGAPADATRQQIGEQLEAIKATYSYLEVSIVDAKGEKRISTEERSTPLDAITAETVRRALTLNSTQVSGIYPTAEHPEARRLVDIATPLLNVHEQPSKTPSVLVLRANADMHLQPFVQLMPMLTSSTGILLAEVRGRNVVVTSTTENVFQFGDLDVLPVSPDQLLAAAGNPPGQFFLAGSEGRFSFAVARRIEGVPWYLVAMIDRNAMQSGVKRIAWIVGVTCAGVLSLLGVALLSWWKGRESDLRLETMQAASDRDLLRRRFDYLSRYANDMIILADADGRIIEVNDKASQVLGSPHTALIDTPLESLFLPSSKAVLQDALRALRERGVAIFEVEKLGADNAVIPVEASARSIQFGGKHIIQLICRDISERRESEAALRESRNRLDSILTSIQDVVWSFSPDFLHLNYINPSAERIYGYAPEAFLLHPQLWFDIVFPDDRELLEDALHRLSAEQPYSDSEYRVVRRDGQLVWLHCRGQLVFDENGKSQRVDGISSDITQRKMAEQQIQVLAYYDSVTMLPNRRLLHDRLAQAMHMATRSEKKVALLFMDLDNFKNINDSLGHHIGDMLLRGIAERLLQCVREEDTVARIGGDEFLVLLPDIEKGTQAVSVAEKILAATSRAFTLQDQQIHTTISVGISVYPDDAQEPNELIQHADSALYQAKSHGRDNYQFFTQELNYQITRSSNIERQLREAIEAGDLRLWYQPQIDTRRGRLIGAEALLRWRRGDSDYLSPVEFIPVAEERGLIGKIGEWALREACMQCRRWQQQGLQPVPVAVNISPIQFQQKGFAGLVTGILHESQLDPRLLELEITESSIMRRAPQVAELAMRLREVGVGISIDDFGTGYSSLSYLKQIPIDKIKIDRSFITDMLTDVDDDAITFAIVNLAHSLNLRVIAEGVESKAQIDRLHSFGCNEVQGHYYSKAVSAQIFEGFLSDRTTFADVATQE